MKSGAFLELVTLTAVVMSLLWTTWKSRRVLRKALGRKLRDDEETSIKTWMTLSDSDLDTAARELGKNPIEPLLADVDVFAKRDETLVKSGERQQTALDLTARQSNRPQSRRASWFSR